MNTSRFALGSAFVAIVASVALTAGTASAQNVPCARPVAPVAYAQPAYAQPVYQQPAYAQPVYQPRPVYVQPAYAQPVVYQQPAYAQPVVYPANYGRVGFRGPVMPVHFGRQGGFGWRHGR